MSDNHYYGILNITKFSWTKKTLPKLFCSFCCPYIEGFFTSFDVTYNTCFYWRNKICRVELFLRSSKLASSEIWKITIHRSLFVVTFAFHQLFGSLSFFFLLLVLIMHTTKGKRQLNNWLAHGREKTSFIFQES